MLVYKSKPMGIDVAVHFYRLDNLTVAQLTTSTYWSILKTCPVRGKFMDCFSKLVEISQPLLYRSKLIKMLIIGNF